MASSRWAAAAAAHTAALATVALALVPGTAAAANAPQQRLDWGDCSGLEAPEGVPMSCARLTVPLDRGAPAGQRGTAELALSRVPAREQRTGTLVVNPGGPGSPGRTWAARTAASLPGDLRDHYDVVGFDPRGTGAATPAVSCDTGYFQAPRPDTVPKTATDSAALVDRAADYAADCARSTGGDLLEHMSTVDSADDIDAIRAALGVERVDYLGYSYGTLLGAVFATRHPDRVRRLVLDSVVAPGRPWYQANLRQSRSLDEAAQNFFAWTARHDDAYGLGDTAGETAEAYYGTRSDLAEAPAQGTVGPTELENTYLTAAYSSATWPELARALSDHARGDAAGLAEVHRTYGESAESDASYGAYLATQCTDSRWPRDTRTWLEDGEEAHADAPFQGWNNIWYNMPCAFWSAPDGTWPTVDGGGISGALLVQAEDDGPTPVGGAFAMRDRFPGARLVLERAGVSHGVALGGNPCVDGAVADYLRDGTLPPAGGPDAADLVCPASPEPEPAAAPGDTPGSREPQAAPALLRP
ncbi:alpha/beta hydrolase [Streptomonospora wellingtoniae]|uniref:Alpha/beta fold hydrolase n=1 Tax=Streptomonospora wellingtoniae TaxID=3075544 RepID=A0ABU2KZ94_9ACTN|nr:alpha/beta fold hydrolase [Streptomonospora sp. DSM 45055]MDT0304625.1 alpha/beta fold hydrolase [Streptomonospora sp. DSM 45055]